VPTKSPKTSQAENWIKKEKDFRKLFPTVGAWLADEQDFSQLLLKVRPDGTTLAIAKGYGPDGGPIVCFGSGYGAIAALMAIEKTMQGGYWKVDKPWDKEKG